MSVLRVSLLRGAPLFAVLLLSAAPARAQSAEADYARAYVLEKEELAYDAALELYRSVAANPRAEESLRKKAHVRAHSVAEEVASRDFARLMPPDSIVYAELNRPGDQLGRLLDQLGLLGEAGPVRAGEALALRPALLEGLMGIRGAALAVTSLPQGGGPPEGVVIVHPGELDLLRGLIETLVPAAGLVADPIEGRPTWSAEGAGFVTLTSRMVVLSQSREEIAGVLRRLDGSERTSLATHPEVRDRLALRRSDLAFFCINAEPVRPLISAFMAQRASEDPQVALGNTLLDVESLESLVGRFGVDDSGLSLDLSLMLEEGHRNLVFNLMRPAPFDVDSLRLVPRGAAAFVSTSFNPRGPAVAPLEEGRSGEPVVTGMDFGRELFTNLVGVTMFVLPPEGAGSRSDRTPIPDAALVLGSNDPERTQALASFCLALGNMALAAQAGGQAEAPESTVVAGRPTQVYTLPPGFPLFVATGDTELVISPSRRAVEAAFAAAAGGPSVLVDDAFAEPVALIDAGTTHAALGHLGRLAQVALLFAPAPERERIAPVAALFEHTVVAVLARHAATDMGVSLAVRGLPRIDGLLEEQLRREKERKVASGVDDSRGTSTLAAADDPIPAGARDAGQLQRRFDRLALERDDAEGADAFARALLHDDGADPKTLNNLAWAFLTEEKYARRFDRLALAMAVASNEASGHGVWQYLDTLALAKFRAGHVEEAIALEERALGLVEGEAERAALEASLASFRAESGTRTVSDR